MPRTRSWTIYLRCAHPLAPRIAPSSQERRTPEAEAALKRHLSDMRKVARDAAEYVRASAAMVELVVQYLGNEVLVAYVRDFALRIGCHIAPGVATPARRRASCRPGKASLTQYRLRREALQNCIPNWHSRLCRGYQASSGNRGRRVVAPYRPTLDGTCDHSSGTCTSVQGASPGIGVAWSVNPAPASVRSASAG